MFHDEIFFQHFHSILGFSFFIFNHEYDSETSFSENLDEFEIIYSYLSSLLGDNGFGLFSDHIISFVFIIVHLS